MKHKFDVKSIKFKLWVYFISFAVAIMAVLLFLQYFLLENFYEAMKTKEIIKAANEIADGYGTLDLEKMRELSYKDDMFIHIETENGLVVYTADNRTVGMGRPAEDTISIYQAKEKLRAGNSSTVSYTVKSFGNMRLLIYGKVIQDAKQGEVFIFISSPLAPVKSTVEILWAQLIWVAVISLLLACALSFFLSRRITRPLVQITESAAALAEGRYNVTFRGGHYTELTRLADTLNHTTQELQRTDELHKDLIANVSHDLKTPLTMIKSYAEMIRDLSGDNPPKRNQHLTVIIDEADRLNVLVNDLLTLSRMQSGVIPIKKEPLDMQEEVQSVLSSCLPIIEDEGFTVHFDVEGNTSAKADSRRIRQVLTNLITNAFRYSKDTKEVHILLQETDTGLLCQVQDHGIGIPADELEHIWERYYRASNHSIRSAAGGSGLGLSIVKEILELHGAEFGVDSQVGQGSTFWFILKK